MPDSRLTLPSPATVIQAVTILRTGGLVAFPTETVYGLGADARNTVAVNRIFRAKRRPADHPLIVHLADANQLPLWCPAVPGLAWQLAEAFWPGPLTLIVKRSSDVPGAVTGGQETVGLRVPAHPVALDLLREFGGGIAAPSANQYGHISPTTAAHVVAELGDDVDMILDGGACAVGIESTIVDLSGAHPRILRPGQLGRESIEEVLGIKMQAGTSGAPRVSGDQASHYAPRTPTRWLEPSQVHKVVSDTSTHTRIGVIALGVEAPAGSAHIEWRALSADPVVFAQQLYARLRELDELRLDVILLEVPPDTRRWVAVRDRLRRAAGSG